MKDKKKSVAGRLFYTFGTILLFSVVAVCTVNFARDGRAFEMPLLSAVTGTPAAQTTSDAVKDSESYKTIKYNKSETKSTSDTSSKGGKSLGKAAATPTPKAKPAIDP